MKTRRPFRWSYSFSTPCCWFCIRKKQQAARMRCLLFYHDQKGLSYKRPGRHRRTPVFQLILFRVEYIIYSYQCIFQMQFRHAVWRSWNGCSNSRLKCFQFTSGHCSNVWLRSVYAWSKARRLCFFCKQCLQTLNVSPLQVSSISIYCATSS